MNPTISPDAVYGITQCWYEVPSATTEGVSYKVVLDVATGALACCCKSRQYRGVCKHERLVTEGRAAKPTVRVQRGAGVPIGVAVGPKASAPAKRAGWICRADWLAQRAAA